MRVPTAISQSRKNRIDYRQSGSLQLFSSLKTGCTRSLPQILLPALLGCSRKAQFRSLKYLSIASLHSSTDS